MNITIKTKVATLTFLFVFLSFNHCYGQIQDTTIYDAYDTYPEFRYGGETSTADSFKKYIFENRGAPIDLATDYFGYIYVRFVIEKDGSISQAKVLHGIVDALDNVVLEIIKKMPKWIPGTKEGKAVRTYSTLPVSTQWLYCSDDL